MINSKAQVTESQAYEAMRRAQVAAAKREMAERGNPFGARMGGSAAIRADDSAACFNRGDFWGVANAAMDSLSYSVGKSSELYQSTLGLVS